MKILTCHILPVLFRVVCVGCVVQLAGCYYPKDADGNGPEEAVRRFVESARAGNVAEAATCWRPGDLANIEDNRRMSFADYCKSFDCDSYLIEIQGADKGYLWVRFIGIKDGKEKRERLYLQDPQHDKEGLWRLIESRWRG